MAVKILLDTNFLLDMIRFKINFEDFYPDEKIEFFVSSSTINELKSISNKKTKEGRLALVALKMIENDGIKVVDSMKDRVDEDLIELAKNKNFIVATNDKDLRKKLKINNIKTICLKYKKRIEVVE
ncbi:MAG: hypothetical protein RMJ18_00260 [Candidatus Aenigmarchaeota archaeon]|nr:hypothetical protein [Candidatus Aenigmarchaeota archaeon]MDW8159849.1 hypothetical protein [Candidatus Aenigmarchaeota archaeon]